MQSDEEPEISALFGKTDESLRLHRRLAAGEDHAAYEETGLADQCDDLIEIAPVFAAPDGTVVAVVAVRGAPAEEYRADGASTPVDGADRDKASEIHLHAIYPHNSIIGSVFLNKFASVQCNCT